MLLLAMVQQDREDPGNDLGEWIKSERARRNWTKKDLAKLLGVSDTAVGQYENRGINPGAEVRAKLEEIFGGPSGESNKRLQGITYAPNYIAKPNPRTVRIAVPGTWDGGFYTAFEPLLYHNGIKCEFEVLKGWSVDPLFHLEEGYCDALIHNHFLITTAQRTGRDIDIRMHSGALNRYRGQFVFVSRSRIEKVKKDADTDTKERLEEFLNHPFNLSNDSFDIPELRNLKDRSLVLNEARLAYIPGTDLEETLRQLWDQAIGPPTWLERPGLSEEIKQLKGRKQSGSLLRTLFESFKAGEFDIFCGGLGELWELWDQSGNNPPQYLPLLDPRSKDLNIHSLNGLIALKSTIDVMREQFDRVIETFYIGTHLFREGYRSLRDIQGEIGPKRTASYIVNLCENACDARSDGVPPDLKFGEVTPRLAWSWAGLMFRFVTFFDEAHAANLAAVDPNAIRYAANLVQLADRI